MITAKRGFPITPVTFGGCCSSSLAGRRRRGCFPSSARSLSKGEGKMSQEHVEAVKRLFAAVRQGDQAGVLEAYHPEVVIHESPSLPYGGDYHGHAEALRHLNGYYRLCGPLQSRAAQPGTPIFLGNTAA